MYHSMPSSGPLFYLVHFFQVGWVGVDLFFVLSGYLITGILLDSAGSRGYYRNFVVRRAFRIFPLYYFSLALACFFAYYPGTIQWATFLRERGGWWFATYLGNFYDLRLNAWPDIGKLVPLWSLQVEEQFYLTYPFLVGWTKPRTLMKILIGAVFGALLLRIILTLTFPGNLMAPYVMMPSRVDALAMGGLVAIAMRENQAWLRHRSIAWITVACGSGFLALFWVLEGTPWPPLMRTLGYSLADATFTGVLILLVAWHQPFLSAVCGNRILAWIGTVSYGIYLLHLPAAEAARRWIEPALGIQVLSSRDMLVCVASGLIAGAVSWVLLERPILRLRDRLVNS
jgi:peptidoglycan/LPS O-acetylase OafA/YrhL